MRKFFKVLLSVILLSHANAMLAMNVQNNLYSAWIKQLPKAGYKVVSGNIFLMQKKDCDKFIGIYKNCFGNNPNSPYIIPQIPTENTYVDPVNARLTEITSNQNPVNIIYRLDPYDALVTVISYPPRAAYFGYQTYLFTRDIHYYSKIKPSRKRTLAPNRSRYEIFSSLGDDINNVVIQRQLNAPPWEKHTVVYITTSNKILAHALSVNAVANHINLHSIFIEPLGSDLKFGYNSKADEFTTLMRYSLPDNNFHAKRWLSSLNENVKVYRVSNAHLKFLGFDSIHYKPHKTNFDEAALKIALNQLADLLKNDLETKQKMPVSIKATKITVKNNHLGIPTKGLVGLKCIAEGTSCKGDNQDTSNYAFLRLRRLGLKDRVFIAGVNHSALNNSNYFSVDIYDARYLSAVTSLPQTNMRAVGFSKGFLTDSAAVILSALHIKIPPTMPELKAHISKLYVAVLQRDCSQLTQSAISKYCMQITRDQVSLFNPISIIERSYIMPGESAGGNVDKMLYPLIIAVKRDFPFLNSKS